LRVLNFGLEYMDGLSMVGQVETLTQSTESTQ
jgi:hypothetical protein